MNSVFHGSQQYAYRFHSIYDNLLNLASAYTFRCHNVATFHANAIGYMNSPSYIYKRNCVPRSLRWFCLRNKCFTHTRTLDDTSIMKRLASDMISSTDEPSQNYMGARPASDLPLQRSVSEQGVNIPVWQHQHQISYETMNSWPASTSFKLPLPVGPPSRIPTPPLQPPLVPTSQSHEISSVRNVSQSQQQLLNQKSINMELAPASSPEPDAQPIAPIVQDSQESVAQKWSQETKVLPQKPTERKWIKTRFGETFTKREDVTFTLMSYNILAQTLLENNKELYVLHDPDSLKWSHRLPCLVKEISGIRPDILNLQEVQESHLNDIAKHLNGIQLNKYLYKKRTSGYDDGCAIFYNGDVYELIDHAMVEYYQPNVNVCPPF